ncbi:MAG: phosphatase PAP2 family protein, partial [Bacilli bacterium]|nr:phosphatase PAP2 family protein [Bacilli bacterium]
MKKWIIFTICLFIFIVVSIYVSFGRTNSFDLFFYNLIINLKNDFFTNFFKFITLFGGEYIIFLITFSFLFFKNKKYFLALFINMISIVLLNNFLKLIFLRERPIDLMIVNETGYSYPSGHTMIAASFYGFIIFLIWNMNMDRKYKYLLSFLLVFLISFIGISRIYLGVHFPSDVIGGEYIIFLITFFFLFFKNKKYFLALFINMISIVLLNNFLKLIFL